MWNEFKQRRKKGDDLVILAEFSQFDNPVNSPEAIKQNMVSMTQAQIREEVYGKFAAYGSNFFSHKLIEHALELGQPFSCFFPLDHPVTGDCLPETDNELIYLPKGRANDTFFTGIDVAGDTQGDSTVLITLQWIDKKLRVVAFEKISKTPLFDNNGAVERVNRRLSQFPGELYYDASGLAGQYLREGLEQQLEPEQLVLTTPINFTKKPRNSKHNHKTLMLSNLLGLYERGEVQIPYDENDRLKPLISELRYYQLDDKGLATDCVMSLALAAYAYKRRRSDVDYSALSDVMPSRSQGSLEVQTV